MSNHQKAFDKLSRLKCGALFMEMGSGKTKVALDIIASKLDKVEFILWICPFSLKNEIEAERIKWYYDMNLHIIGCESIGSSDRVYARLLAEICGKNVFCVVDESIKIKNISAKRTQRILKIGGISKYRLILNGTPVSRNIIDLWTQMQFLSPLILGVGFRQFVQQYIVFSNTQPKYIKSYKNLKPLINLIEPYVFDSRLEIDIHKYYHIEWYNNDQSKEYMKIKDEILDRLGYDNFDFYELCSRLQRCYTQSPSKQKIVDKIISQILDPVIVFVKYQDSIPNDAINITGNNNMSERKKILQDFKDGKFKVLYMTYGVGSYGLNLQFCHNIIFAEHSFDYAQKIQAEYRIFRIGQTHDVNYYNVYCDCGLEKMIEECLDKKESLLNHVKREIKERGTKWVKSI